MAASALKSTVRREIAPFQGKRLGLLGGSFNPAHAGHIHISDQARQRLNLDVVLWLVSPANPLKDVQTLHDYSTRLHHAQTITASTPWLHVSDIEQRIGAFTTHASLSQLAPALTHSHPVWLMGGDSLCHFHRWHAWQHIIKLMPIAVLDRPNQRLRAMHSPAATFMRPHWHYESAASGLATSQSPAWTYLSIAQHQLSATDLRKSLGKTAFLGHNG